MLYNNLFYFDIETAGNYDCLETFKRSDIDGYNIFMKKLLKNEWILEKHKTPEDAYLNTAPLFSTYGKTLCLSFGYYNKKSDVGYTINSLYGGNEEELMIKIQKLFVKVSEKHLIMSGFNINVFDIPWIVHKLNKYDLDIPNILKIYGKKPWEIQSLDLFNEWKGPSRYFSSFEEVCYELDVPSPKDGIDGSMVHSTYWKEGDLEKIKTYCEKDVRSSMLVAEKMLKNYI